MRFKLLLFLLGCTILVGLWNFKKQEARGNDYIIFSIPPGSSAKGIASILVREGVVKNERWFLSLIKLRNASSKLHAGVYRFKSGTSSWHVLSGLISGKTYKIRLTIPEGYSSWQIAEKLSQETGVRVLAARDGMRFDLAQLDG